LDDFFVFWIDNISIELNESIHQILLIVLLDHSVIFNEIISHEVNLISISINFLKEQNWPYEGINSFVMIIFCNVTFSEMESEYTCILPQHFMKISYKNIFLFNI